MSCVSFMRQQCSGNQNSPNLQTLGIKERYNVMENSTEWFQTNNFLFVLIFFSILSPAKRPFQADGSKWLKRLLLVANRDRPCTFVHFLTPPPPISLPSLSPMTSIISSPTGEWRTLQKIVKFPMTTIQSIFKTAFVCMDQ